MPRLYRTETDRALQKARRRAMRKVRYWADKGVTLTPPTFGDVRAMAGSTKLAEIRRIEKFIRTDPGVVLKRGATVPRNEWRKMEKTIRAVNKHSMNRITKYADLSLPGGMTVGQFNAMKFQSQWDKRMSPAKHPHAPGVYAPVGRTPTGFDSAHGVRRQQKAFEDRLTGEWQRRMSEAAKRSALDMLVKTGNDDLVKRVENLSSEQMDVLMNLTPFMHSIKMKYEEWLGKASTRAGEIAISHAAQILDEVEKKVKG